MTEATPHIALLGAFHFPVPQGSQVYVAEQGRALVAAGARVTLICYGGRALDPADWPFEVVQTPRWTAPGSHTAGPRLRKPLADLALLRTLLAEQRARRFDAVLAHNAEAALVALQVRRSLGIPVVYVAHTLLGEELGVYAPRALEGFAYRAGRSIDRSIARRADGVIALSESARATLSGWSEAPVERLPPGLLPGTAPDALEIAKQCALHQLEPGRFALYAGNLDAYQDLDDLVDAAVHVPEIPIVIATHEPARRFGRVRVVSVRDRAAMRALTFGSAVTLSPRRHCPGFPIKLLNYMEAGRAILARQGVGGTLTHDRDAWLLPTDAKPEALAHALRVLWEDEALRARLGAAARDTLAREHAWPALAARTLDLVQAAAQHVGSHP